MTKRGAETVLGFLTTVHHKQHGVFGGYLLLNKSGRPLEFHCTAPVRPNRAQEILYGPTLKQYLYGELIGQTLVEKATVQPLMVCIDREPLLALRGVVNIPVAQVLSGEQPPEEDDGLPATQQPRSIADGPFDLGINRLSVALEHTDDREAIRVGLGELSNLFDLAEPFSRIRDAIKEAQQGKG